MLKQRSDQAFLTFLCFTDLLITCICWVAAYFLRWNTGVVAPVNDVPPFWWCIRSLPLVVVVAMLSYQMSGLYQLGRRWPLWQEVFHVFKATALMLLLSLATTFYGRNPYESRLASVLFWGLTFVGLVVVRRALGTYFRLRRRKGGAGGKALIVGTGRTARSIEQALRANNWLGVQPMGFVDDDSASANGSSALTVGTIAELPALIEAHGIDYVFIALPLYRYAETKRIFRALANTLVEIRLVPDVPQLASMTVHVRELEGLPVLSLRATPHGFTDVVLKRAMDVVLSAVGIVILSPLLGLIALLIKLSDRGPILYAQERMGLNGHRFRMYKFRSMRVDAEQSTGPVWASEKDNRRTRLGAFLRESSLDELPQLYNVLVGDMSLVGPRPERPHFISNFRRSIPKYMLRHAVKAGITGWAQVNGWRGNTSLRKRVQYDLYYIANWSLWLDVRILFLTVVRAMWDKHAY